MYIKSLSILLLLFTGYIAKAQSEIIGKWKNENSGSIIEIYKQNNLFYGKIIKVSGNEAKEKVGHLLLDKLTFLTTTGKYTGNVNSTNGMTADCELKLINQDRFQMTVTKLFINKTQIFVRTE
jgi:uncharacterized protein (DUF2147 family)